MSAKPTTIAYSISPTICRKKPPKRCWSLLPAARRLCRPMPRPKPTPSSTPTPVAASASCTTWRNWNEPSTTPWEKWVVFLHPAQRELVERTYNGPARVSGSAGTGKTIVALHRAVYLARTNPRCPSSAHDILRDAGQCPPQQAAYTDQFGAESGRTHRSLRHRRPGREALPPQPGRVHACIVRTDPRTHRRSGRRSRRQQVLNRLHPHRVGTGR